MRPSFGRRAPNLRTRRRFVRMGKAGSCKLVPGLACGRVTTVPELDGRKEPGGALFGGAFYDGQIQMGPGRRSRGQSRDSRRFVP
eukprot:scaffold5575_cov216-Pinguiococcus_pyrenoidosus.AAC.1